MTSRNSFEQGWFGQSFALVFAVTAIRWFLLAFNGTDLFVDETQYWLWGQEFALGYYSKPPLIAWVIGSVTAVFGDSPFAIRAPGAAFHAATALILAALAAQLYGRVVVAVWVAAAYVTLPMVGVGSLLISTDTIMAPFFAAALFFHRSTVETGRARDALLAGAMIGLACLAKYAGIYFLMGVALAALLRRDMRLSWRNAGLLVTAWLVVLSPNLLWNLAHGLTTLSHTADNIGWVRQDDKLAGVSLAGLAEFLLSQFAVMGPGLFLALLFSLTRPAGGLATFVLPVLLIVSAQALIDRAYANWAASAYFGGTVMAVAVLSPRLRWIAIGLNGALCLAIAVLTTQPQTEWGGKPLLSRYLGRAQISREVIALAAEKGGLPILAEDRAAIADLFYTGRDSGLMFYAPAPPGRPMHHYQQRHPLPANVSGPIIWLTDTSPPCAGAPIPMEDREGGFRAHRLYVYLTDAECARGQ
jgi:4-amino-4-deoxy-L-arabinose transferase-like glycosyltransferase